MVVVVVVVKMMIFLVEGEEDDGDVRDEDYDYCFIKPNCKP
jgi:hypothetical protein